MTVGVVPEELDRRRQVRVAVSQPLPAGRRRAPARASKRDAARPDEAAAEAGAAELRRHVQEVAAQPPAERRRRQDTRRRRERAEVAGVVREPLELERDAAERLRARRRLDSGERLDRLA